MNECNAGALVTSQKHNSLLIFCLGLHLSIPVYVTQVGLDLSYQVFTCICLVALRCVCVCVSLGGCMCVRVFACTEAMDLNWSRGPVLTGWRLCCQRGVILEVRCNKFRRYSSSTCCSWHILHCTTESTEQANKAPIEVACSCNIKHL